MKRKFLAIASLIVLCLVTIAITVNAGKAQRAEFETPTRSRFGAIVPLLKTQSDIELPTTCAIQPEPKSSRAMGVLQPLRPLGSVDLSRFRQVQPPTAAPPPPEKSAPAATSYQPREEITLIDPTNYGDRYLRDINGNSANLEPLVVFHETVGSAYSAITLFRTPHPRDDDQSSYHTLIKQDGTIVYLVPPDKRAYGAGNSSFPGNSGLEAVKTNPDFPASVNNFAYHVSLETPPDGNSNAYSHSGYTDLQYQSLAWLVAKTGVDNQRITTHKAIDRSGMRMDPRTFSFPRFFQLLQTYPKTTDISIRCTATADPVQSQLPTPHPATRQAKVRSPTAQQPPL